MELCKWILATEANVPGKPYDSLDDYWAGGSGGPSETNSPLANIPKDHYPIGDGFVDWKIIDEERYININTINPTLLNGVLTAMGVAANDQPTVSDSILDWVQQGDNPRLSGAKNSYYMSLNPPYYCKEAPMDDIGELLLVKGVTTEMFTGQSPAGAKTSAAPKGFGFSPFENNGYAFGLRDVFTPYSDGRININTADANVLQCIPGVDPSTADAIIKARTSADGGGLDAGADGSGPFKSVGEVQRAGVSPQATQSIGQYCDVRSHTFKVIITAHYLTDSQTYIGVLWRNSPNDIRLVQFYAEPQPHQQTAPSPTALTQN
jgi:type II secretory pathway component PulK